MVYLEQLQHADDKVLGSIVWHREKAVKRYTPERKRRLIMENRQKTARLMNEWHKKNNNYLRRDTEIWTVT